MSPILGIVRVKFLSGRRTDGRRREGGTGADSLSLHSLAAALHFKNWSTFRGQADGTSSAAATAGDTSVSAFAKVTDLVPSTK